MSASERYRTLTRIFMVVCGLKGDARKAELDRLCRDLPDLRADLESLLAFHDASATPPDGSLPG